MSDHKGISDKTARETLEAMDAHRFWGEIEQALSISRTALLSRMLRLERRELIDDNSPPTMKRFASCAITPAGRALMAGEAVKAEHLFQGQCPFDDENGMARDPDCPACGEIRAADLLAAQAADEVPDCGPDTDAEMERMHKHVRNLTWECGAEEKAHAATRGALAEVRAELKRVTAERDELQAAPLPTGDDWRLMALRVLVAVVADAP